MRFKTNGAYRQEPTSTQDPLPLEGEKHSEVEKRAWFLKCVKCFGPADLLFEGTSYCETDLREWLRTG
jgi:hypothetical protein